VITIITVFNDDLSLSLSLSLSHTHTHADETVIEVRIGNDVSS